jgi:hypothetical protein
MGTVSSVFDLLLGYADTMLGLEKDTKQAGASRRLFLYNSGGMLAKLLKPDMLVEALDSVLHIQAGST